MFSKCSIHDVEMLREYPKDGMGKYFEYCPVCRKEFLDTFKRVEDIHKNHENVNEMMKFDILWWSNWKHNSVERNKIDERN